MQKEFLIKTKNDDEIQISAFGIENINSLPCILCIHGFKGFKDWGFWPFTCKYLSENGFFVLSFNFSHNGIGSNPTEFTELVKFASDTVSMELDELLIMIDLYNNNYFGKKSSKRLGLIGHSRGGAVALLSTMKRNIDAVCLWAAISDFDRYTDHQKINWRKKGFLEFQNSRTKQMMKLNLTYLDDIEKNKDRLNLETSIRNYKNPLLIIHGEQDLTVRHKESKQIFDWSESSEKKILFIPNTGHTYGAQHPFDKSNQVLDSVLKNTKEFFHKYLN